MVGWIGRFELFYIVIYLRLYIVEGDGDDVVDNDEIGDDGKHVRQSR